MAAGAAAETVGSDDGRLGDALREYAAAGFSGVLHVEGRPGGVLYFDDGGIAGCETPGAPSLEVILLRSQRVTEAEWDSAFTAAAQAGHPMTGELVSRGLLGAGESEALLRTALADAVFAVLSGAVDGWVTAPAADCPLPLSPPARPGWLLGEAARRGQVLASFAGPPFSALDRVAAGPDTSPGPRPAPARDALLALADGRRSARDLAFALGHGLYPTMLELARMRSANLVTVVRRGQAAPATARPAELVPDGEADDETLAGLPRRHQERPGSHRAADPGRRIFTPGIRLLRPRSEGGARLPGDREPGRKGSGRDFTGGRRKCSTTTPC